MYIFKSVVIVQDCYIFGLLVTRGSIPCQELKQTVPPPRQLQMSYVYDHKASLLGVPIILYSIYISNRQEMKLTPNA